MYVVPSSSAGAVGSCARQLGPRRTHTQQIFYQVQVKGIVVVFKDLLKRVEDLG